MTFSGRSVSEGMGIGTLFIPTWGKIVIPQDSAENTVVEIEKLKQIIGKAEAELIDLHAQALNKLGADEADIFDAHLTILQDEYAVYFPIEELIIKEKQNVARAIGIQFDSMVEQFSSLDDPLMKERALDFADLRDILLRIALGMPGKNIQLPDANIVLLTNELTPSDTMRLDLTRIVGFATQKGGETAHVAIIARTLGIPAVAGISGWEDILVGRSAGSPRADRKAIVDGQNGRLIIDPSGEEILAYEEFKRQNEAERIELEPYQHKNTMTRDLVPLQLYANIGNVSEAEKSLDYGPEGIGLFRSEFLFMDRENLPTEEEQFEAYRSVLQAMGDRFVIIRTLDIGGDKKLPALPLPLEENPFLGYRAIRMCLDKEDVFLPQLRALLRSGAYGNLGIMLPMVSDITEIHKAKQLISTIQAQLIKEGKTVGNVKTGIMIETPAAAIMAKNLAEEADFFSIGTNDLIQYTMAAERGNISIGYLYSPYQPAVLQLINMTAKAAQKAHILCGMCGEAAGNSFLAPVFIGLGITELSMVPKQIPKIRRQLSEKTMEDCRITAQKTLEMKDATSVEKYLRQVYGNGR